MKFGKQLQHQLHPDWGMHYVNYKQLKRAIKIAKPGTKGTAYFQSQVHEQLQAVNMFYASKEQSLSKWFLKISTADQDQFYAANFSRFCDELLCLRTFVMLNYMAVMKIIKKFSKKHGNGNIDAMRLLHAQPFFHSRELGSLCMRAEMLALKLNPDQNEGTEEEWSCPICLKVLSNPVALECSHRFCWSCVTRALDVTENCPVCRKPVAVNEDTFKVDWVVAKFLMAQFPRRTQVSSPIDEIWRLEDVCHHILGFLDAASLTRFGECSTELHVQVSHPTLWKELVRKRFPEMYRKISAEAGHVVGHITTGSFSSAAPVERVNQKVTQTAQLDDPDCSAALKRIQCLLAETQECLAETEQWLADGGGDFDEKAYLMQTSMIAMASKMSKLISSVDSLQLLQRGIAEHRKEAKLFKGDDPSWKQEYAVHHLREQLLALVERITDEEARLKAEGKQFRACQDQIQNLPGKDVENPDWKSLYAARYLKQKQWNTRKTDKSKSKPQEQHRGRQRFASHRQERQKHQVRKRGSSM
jgi:hypothetical protein|mmetsp:Transcript_1196/g.2105  ORF Transcript_1196/g.2105 Transcript_1196/m.2105 type:complete len:529 (+) Transcript_1196:37-1623(+)